MGDAFITLNILYFFRLWLFIITLYIFFFFIIKLSQRGIFVNYYYYCYCLTRTREEITAPNRWWWSRLRCGDDSGRDHQMTLDGSMSNGLVSVLVPFSRHPFCTSRSVSGPTSWAEAAPATLLQAARTCCRHVRPSWSTALAFALYCGSEKPNKKLIYVTWVS